MCVKISVQLTIYFDSPFWAGVFEITHLGKIEVCKVIFGAEPKDYEVYEFILKNYNNLIFSNPTDLDEKYEKTKRVNPKRQLRQIRKLTEQRGISTKAQQAIKLEQELRKTKSKKTSKESKETKKKTNYEKKHQKKKEKRRGH